MVGVYAAPHSAKVIQGHAIRDSATNQNICGAMCVMGFQAAAAMTPIAGIVEWSRAKSSTLNLVPGLR